MTLNDFQKKSLIGLVLAVLIVGATGAGYLFFTDRHSADKPSSSQAPGQTLKLMTSTDAYVLAAAKAKRWQADALLSYQKSLGKADVGGGADDWLLIFVSKSARGKGFEITIKNKELTETRETDYVGEGSDAATELITPEEAIKKAEEVRGGKIEVLGVEAIYNQDAKEWFWGIKTPKSVISIKASK